MKKILNLIILGLICTSCAYPIVKDNIFEEDEDLTIHGNVNKITSYEIHEVKMEDSAKSIIYYDSKGKPLRQIDFHKKNKETTIMSYDKEDRLKSEQSDSRNNFRSEYEYDENGNLAIYKQIYDGKISFEKKHFYDKRDNVLLHIFSNDGKPADTTNFSYDYKKKIRFTKFKSDFSSKTYFNKKGNITKKETKNGSILYEYDSMGRISKKTVFNLEGKLKFQNLYLNKYDRRKNLVETNVIVDGKPYSKTIILIDYN